ncbi:MAG: hypothetical protein AB2562_06065 [Candidatus Thiodiazotropha sp.]
MDREVVSKIISLHGKVARRFKEYEHKTSEHPPIEVVNELRYALRAVIVLLGHCTDPIINDADVDSEIEAGDAFERAMHALYCAYHDLVDGLHIELVGYMEKLTREYTNASISVLGEKRPEIIDFIEEVEHAMVESRGHGLKRTKIYDDKIYNEYFEKLLNYKVEMVRDILPEVITLHNSLQRDLYEGDY